MRSLLQMLFHRRKVYSTIVMIIISVFIVLAHDLAFAWIAPDYIPVLPGETGATVPDIAYNQSSGYFLEVFRSRQSDDEYYIYGIIKTQTGEDVGSKISISTSGNNFHPSVAAAVDGSYWVVVWEIVNSYDNGIIACRVNSDGSIPWCWWLDRDITGVENHNPDIGVDVLSGRFLVVWQDEDLLLGYRIKGEFLDGDDGLISGSEIYIEGNAAPAVTQTYLNFFVVAEQEYGYGRRIIGRYVEYDGDMPYSAVVFTDEGMYNAPDVAAADNETDEIVTVWHKEWDAADYDIYYALSSRSTVTSSGTIEYDSTLDYNPTVNFTGVDNKYVITYSQAPNGQWVGDWDIVARTFTTSGSVSDKEYVADTTTCEGSPVGSTIGGTAGKVILAWDRCGASGLYARMYQVTPPPTVQFSSDSYQVNENGGSIMITVVLSSPASQSTSVNYFTSSGSAIGGIDYTSTSGELMFNVGDVSKQVYVTITNDPQDENNEVFTVNLSDPTNASLGDPSTTQISILDDDTAVVPTLQLNSSSYSVSESGGSKTITANLSSTSSQVISVSYTTWSGSAIPGNDYTTTSGQLTFNPGETSKSFSVPIISDTLDEVDEYFWVSLSDPVNATLGDPNISEVTILDDDTAVTTTVQFDASVYNINENSGGLTIRLLLSAPSDGTLQVYFDQIPGTAGESDYAWTHGYATFFTVGQTSLDLYLPIIDDSLTEGTESLTVYLANPINCALASPYTAQVNILDDDAVAVPGIQFSSSSYSVNESGSNQTITANLSNPTSQTVTVNYATTNGTAAAGSDFTTTSGQLTFNPGETSKSFSVPIISDSLDEVDEYFIVNLTNPVNATLGNTNVAQVTILDDDTAGTTTVQFDASVYNVNENAGGVTIRLLLSAPSNGTLQVYFDQISETADDSDYAWTHGYATFFTVGQTTLDLYLPIINDTLLEGTEYLTVYLANPINCALASPYTARVNIIDNDLLTYKVYLPVIRRED